MEEATFIRGVTWPDVAILAIITLSALLSLWRGYVREMLSLVTWVAAFWIAFNYAERGALLLTEWIAAPSARMAAAFAVLFVLTLIVGALFALLIGYLVERTGLSGTDRMLGLLFGVARGVAVVALLVLLAGLTPLPRDPWWQESQLIGHFEKAAAWMRERLPPEIASHISY